MAAAEADVAERPAPVWGPAVSVAALVLANLLAVLLNPGLFRSYCGRRRKTRAELPTTAAAPPSPAAPRFCRCRPLPFFASNVSEQAAARAAGRRPPLPRQLWGFDVLSPLDPLSSWLVPSSVRRAPGGGASGAAGGGGAAGAAAPAAAKIAAAAEADDQWRPALWVLIPLHAFTFAYFAAYVLVDTLWRIPKRGPPDHPYPQWLSYLTNWSISLLGLAGLLGLANALRCCCRCCCSSARGRPRHGGQSAPPPGAAPAPTPPPPPPPAPREERWDWLSVSHVLVAETAASAAFFVTIFYWGGVVGLGQSGGLDLSSGVDATTLLAHAGNAGVAALLLLLTRLPVASSHFLALLWFASLYEVFAWAYGAATKDWRYGLDWRRAGPAVAYVLVPVFCFLVFFLLTFGLAALREAVGRRRGWCAPWGRRSSARAGAAGAAGGPAGRAGAEGVGSGGGQAPAGAGEEQQSAEV